jgi:hypothetical protein
MSKITYKRAGVKDIPELMNIEKHGFTFYAYSKNHYGPGLDRVILEFKSKR